MQKERRVLSMIVYHGSYKDVMEVDLSKAVPNKDFGRGFYTTKNREQAEIWARRRGEHHGTLGFVSEFDFNENAFFDNNYKTLRFPDYTEEWFDFVVSNRNRKTASLIHDYDIVEGPVADDDVFARVDDYLNGKISKKGFLADLAQFPDSHQICFCTVKSLHSIERVKHALYDIKKIGISIVDSINTDYNLSEADSEDLYFTSDTYAKLSDETTKLYEKSWREIYEMLKKEREMW
jgi:hypothetical protein